MGNKSSKIKRDKDNGEKEVDDEDELHVQEKESSSSEHNKVEDTEKRTDLSTYGYIREELHENGNISNVNEELIHNIAQIIIKYHPLTDIKWSAKYGECSHGLTVSNNNSTIERNQWMFGFQSCFIDTIITNEMCKRFEIEFVFIFINYPSDFHFGYQSKDGQDLGGFNFISAAAIESLDEGDIIKVSFDFETDDWSIYHNDNYINKHSLNGIKSLLPGVSLLRSGGSVQIGNHNFYN